MVDFPVVLDANVLFGILPTDLLLTTAGLGLYRAQWTETIIDEARRNVLAKRPDLDPTKVEQRFAAMNKAMPEALMSPPPTALAQAMTNDPSDRHVLAAAVSARAEIIVTENTKHFPPSACSPYGIKTRTLDSFVTDLVSLDPELVWTAILQMKERRGEPPVTLPEICEILQRYVPETMLTLQLLGFETGRP